MGHRARFWAGRGWYEPEARGIVHAARTAPLPVGISITLRTVV
jgi:hypothetical protein